MYMTFIVYFDVSMIDCKKTKKLSHTNVKKTGKAYQRFSFSCSLSFSFSLCFYFSLDFSFFCLKREYKIKHKTFLNIYVFVCMMEMLCDSLLFIQIVVCYLALNYIHILYE